jgi:hypothetical protein
MNIMKTRGTGKLRLQKRNIDTAISYCGRTTTRREQCVAKSIGCRDFLSLPRLYSESRRWDAVGADIVCGMQESRSSDLKRY